MAITRVKIRATIEGAGFYAETPYINQFTVTKTRNNISSFSASVKVRTANFDATIYAGPVVISAGVKTDDTTDLKKVFTGIIRKATISPCWDDPTYVLLNISGEDILSELRGKKITRRQIKEKGSWATIDSVIRRGLRSDKFSYINRATMQTSPNEELNDKNIQNRAEKFQIASKNPLEGANRDELANLEIQLSSDITTFNV